MAQLLLYWCLERLHAPVCLFRLLKKPGCFKSVCLFTLSHQGQHEQQKQAVSAIHAVQELHACRKVNLTYTVLQACSDAVRFLDERKAGMLTLLERSVRDAAGQHKVVSRTACMLPPQTCSCAIVSCSS